MNPWVNADDDYIDWCNGLVEQAPSRFDGDESQENIVTEYVRALEAEVRRLNPTWFSDDYQA